MKVSLEVYHRVSDRHKTRRALTDTLFSEARASALVEKARLLLGEKDWWDLKTFLLAEGRGAELEHLLFEEFDPPSQEEE